MEVISKIVSSAPLAGIEGLVSCGNMVFCLTSMRCIGVVEYHSLGLAVTDFIVSQAFLRKIGFSNTNATNIMINKGEFFRIYHFN